MCAKGKKKLELGFSYLLLPLCLPISPSLSLSLDSPQKKKFFRVRLNRPKKLNALSEEMLNSLQDTLDRIAEDRTVRVVVLAGQKKKKIFFLFLSLSLSLS